MKMVFLPVFALFVLLGCVFGPPQPGSGQGVPDQNNFDQNFFSGSFDRNGIRVDLDSNRIFFKFDVDLNSPQLDLNILTSACNVSCGVIDANKWRVVKDLNYGIFSCICTKTFCYRQEETQTQIIKYCTDYHLGLIFDGNRN